MAFIGMRHVVGALITNETAGSEPTYGTSGTGFIIGKAITGNLTINRNNNPLYADDAIAEDDNGITSMDLELGLDDLMEDIQDKMGLLKAVTAGSPSSSSSYSTYVPVGLRIPIMPSVPAGISIGSPFCTRTMSTYRDRMSSDTAFTTGVTS